jgi:hypothetical protein
MSSTRAVDTSIQAVSAGTMAGAASCRSGRKVGSVMRTDLSGVRGDWDQEMG